MTKKIFSIEKGTEVFVKNINKKLWIPYTTTKALFFFEKNSMDFFPVEDYTTFKRENWLLAIENKYIKEEEFAE